MVSFCSVIHRPDGLNSDYAWPVEAMSMVQALISQNPDIQKVLAFEGAFEKLFNIVTQEGGVDGGAVASSALTCVDGLLRFNTSNQVSFAASAVVIL
jgi:hypothetical protein